MIDRDPASPATLAQPAYGFGEWWAGLPTGAKVWTIVAIVVVVGVTADALSSDESVASQFVMSP